MSKSKDPDPFNLNSLIDTTGDININLDDTYGATTTYMADSVYDVSGATDTITISDGTFTITDDATTTINIGDWNLSGDFGAISINPHEVEKMCEHYPGLEKVWRNFKAVYDMCKQDFEGKKKAGEVDDDIPF